MHPSNLALVDAPVVLLDALALVLALAEADALAAGALPELTLDELLPHAASSRVAAPAPAAAAVINAVCFTISSTEPVAVAQA
jgi:hypothetical protein